MARPFRRPSRRERITANNAALRFYAGASERPDAQANLEKLIVVLPPKREIRRPVDKRPIGPSEHQEQSAVIQWWALVHQKYQLPEFALFAIPNGGARDPITGARLKAEGVRRGIVDLCLAAPRAQYHGWYGEMKVGDNKPNDEQSAVIEYLNGAGYLASVHWDSASAIKAIEDYLGA